ncbi:hypothetical protein APY04_1304 [Hyphomicrobium sulfonivorans]|uniref:Uncharacterized protein n=1 Tax=Hyphomicrobium sulfonivorans TaxID=121290 RepID=A0A109BJG3_HYPSL|nr:hypothetical protein APY04_1304 [Hyphomicrobium sulfonivorans]
MKVSLWRFISKRVKLFSVDNNNAADRLLRSALCREAGGHQCPDVLIPIMPTILTSMDLNAVTRRFAMATMSTICTMVICITRMATTSMST